MSFRFFMCDQHPVPQSTAQLVHYPACEWVGENGEVDLHHPLNRFVGSWLTSDVGSVQRCQDVLAALRQVQAGHRSHCALDGDAFVVDVHPHGVQFNFSHVGPDDEGWWNLPQGRFAVRQLLEVGSEWLKFLMQAQ